jgi:ABC-2 type transport system permease protein
MHDALDLLPGRRWRSALYGAWQADWRERRRDWRVWLVIGLGLALAACAAWLTALELQQTRAARHAAESAEQQRWVQQGNKSPHSAAHYGIYVFKPLSTLAALDPGIEQYVGSSVWLEAHRQNDMVYRPAADATEAGRQFRLSPALVLQVLAPAAMIFLGFGMFAAERERGMLAALRVNAAPLGAVALARCAMLLCLALVMAVPACLAIVAVKWYTGGEEPFADGAVRGAVFAAGYLLYLATWAALIAAVSARAANLRASLAILVATWTVLTLVAPRAATEVAQAVAPLPTMQAFRAAVEAELGMPDDPQEAEHHKQQLLRQYGVTDVRDLPVNWSGVSLLRGEEHGNAVFDHHYGRLYDTLQRQSEAMALAGWLSPAVAISGLSASLAASDTSSHLAFVRGAEAHRRTIQVLLNTEVMRHPDRDGVRYEADATLWQQIPQLDFHHNALDWRTVFARYLLPLLTLLAACTALAVHNVRQLRHGGVR